MPSASPAALIMVAPVFLSSVLLPERSVSHLPYHLEVAPTVGRTGLAVATGTGVAVAATGEFEVLLSLSSLMIESFEGVAVGAAVGLDLL